MDPLSDVELFGSGTITIDAGRGWIDNRNRSRTTDSYTEGEESFYLNLKSASNAAIAANSIGDTAAQTVEITIKEATKRAIDINDARAEEGKNLEFTVTVGGYGAGDIIDETIGVEYTIKEGGSSNPAELADWASTF